MISVIAANYSLHFTENMKALSKEGIQK